MWSDGLQPSVKALLVTACFLLGNPSQVNSHLVGNCSEAQVSPNCSAVSTCPTCVRVSWLPRKPYVYKSDRSSIGGFLYGLLNLMLNKCCGNHSSSCWQVMYQPPKTDPEKLLHESRDSHVIYPVLVDSQDAANEKLNMIGLVPPASIAFVVPKGKRGNFPQKLMTSVFEAWPVLILAFLLSILAGVFLWLLDTWLNEKEFPRTFFRGSWEGFWWAFVSMTTVGYGDRAPRSFLGRTFAVAWILIGVCICSIFTATLTTSLTTITMDTKKSLPGSKVGVLKRSIEMALGMQQQADLQLYNSVEEMRKALDKGKIEGVLLDNYQISHYAETLFPDTDFKADAILKEETLSYGAVVNDSYLATCFRNVIAEDKYLLYDFTRHHFSKTLKGGGDEAVQNSQSIFDPTGDLFFPSLYSCLGLVVFIFFIGLVAEVFYFRRGQCPCNKEEELTDINIAMTETEAKTPLDELEKEMITEMKALFNKYREKLDQNSESYSNSLSMHSA